MPLTQQELELKALAIERIRRNVLPAQVPKSIWAGPGSGEPCSLCEQTIAKTDMEYELDTSASNSHMTVRLHLRCHALWQLEVARQSELVARRG
jgi:hypothetical protein